jgi:hypothetical protein
MILIGISPLTTAGACRRSRRIAAACLPFALALLLGACQALVPQSWKIPAGQAPAPVSLRSTLDAADLFAYTQRLLMMNRDELLQEISQRRERAQSTHLDLDRAKLAIALTLPTQGQRDTTRALLALAEVPRNDPTIDRQAATLMNYVETLLAWQGRQEEALQAVLQPDHATGTATPPPAPSAPQEVANLQALAQKLRAEQRRNESQIETLSTRLREEKARGDALQQKIDALGNLEKSLAERKPPVRTDPPR